jgi:tetratricopeptide (TPR) repeat protein
MVRAKAQLPLFSSCVMHLNSFKKSLISLHSFCFLLVVLSLMAISQPVYAQSVKDLFDEAAQAFYAGQYDKAIKNYERIIEMEPNFAPAYNALGLALKVKGAANDDVIYYFTKAMELDPSFLASYDNLGKLYYSIGDVDHAEEYFQKGLKLDPQSESMTLSMGWIYLLGRNDADQAIKYFREVATKNNSAMGYFGQGICLMSKEKRMEVIDIVTQLRAINQEGLAQDLETMLRENRSLIRDSEFPTATTIHTAAKAQAPTELPASNSSSKSSGTSFSEYDDKGELRIRLLDKLPSD